MNDADVESAVSLAKEGDKEAIDRLDKHVWALRHLIAELAEGLDDPSLKELVDGVMGWGR